VSAVEQQAGKRGALPQGVMPRGLSRVQAADYVGVSPVTFDRMVSDKLMPAPIRIYGRVVWDARAIDAAFTALDSASPEVDNPWSKMAT
jgi:predicted DNA-binding transcriptional regulator AlpA